MIVKKIPNPAKSTSAARRIELLAAYIRAPESEDAREKCTYYGARGFFDDRPDAQVSEMSDLARSATRSRDPTIHYVLSWQAGEHPTDEQVEEAVDLFCAELDALPKPDNLSSDHRSEEPDSPNSYDCSKHRFAHHQMIYGLHADTDHDHLHLMINRVDPESERTIKINRGWDVDAGIRAGARIEHAQGWAKEPNKRYRVARDGSIVRTSAADPDAPRRPSQRDLRMERDTNKPSPTRIAIDRALPIIARADSWPEVHAALATSAMRYMRSGPGAIIMIGDAPVRASQVDRAVTLDALIDRLGPYEPPEAKGAPAEAVRPTDVLRILRNTKSWRAVHTSLAAIGVAYERKGRGAVVRTVDGATWKASDLAQDATLRRLEERFGTRFEERPTTPADRTPTTPTAAEPLDPRAVAEIIDSATTWHELHRDLNYRDVTYERKGSGAIVRSGDTQMKASTVSRRATLAHLERRLGPFAAPAHKATTVYGGQLSREYNDDRARSINDHAAQNQEEHDKHHSRMKEIDEAARREQDGINREFPRPPRRPAAAATSNDPAPAPKDPADRAAAARKATEERIIHDLLTQIAASDRHRERAKENRAYRRWLRALRRAYETTESHFAWLLDRRHLAPARDWERPEPDGVLRPAAGQEPPPRPPTPHEIDAHTPCQVGRRIDYRDNADDLAISDLGSHIIVRRPTDLERRLAGLQLAAEKWNGLDVEAVNIPRHDEIDIPVIGAISTVSNPDIHEEIKRLAQIRATLDAQGDSPQLGPHRQGSNYERG